MSRDGAGKKQWHKFFSQKTWLLDFVFLGILTFFGIYLIRGIFAPGFFYNYDLSQHFTESVYVATVLLPKYHQLIGWNPYFYLGWPQGQFNPPASYLIYSGLYYLLFWALPSLTIYKIMLVGFFVLPAFSLYFATKRFGLSRISAFFAGFIVLGTAGGFELGGPLDTIYYGMYEFAAAVALIPLILALYHQSLSRKSWKLLSFVGVLVAFDFMLHTIAGLFAIAVLLIYMLAELLRLSIFSREGIRRMTLFRSVVFKSIVIALIVLGICSFWIIPAYANRSFYDSQPYLVGELGNYATTFNDVRLGYIFGEEATPLIVNVIHPSQPEITLMTYSTSQTILSATAPLFYQFLLALAVLGGVVALVRSRFRFPALVIVSIIALFLLISIGPKQYESLWKLPILHMFDLRPARAAAVARTFLAILAGAGLGETFIILYKLSSSNKIGLLKHRASKMAIKVLSFAFLIFLSLTLVVNSYELMNQLPLGSTTSNLAQGPSVPQLFSWIHQNVPNNSRVAYEEYTTDIQHLLAASPVETGVPEVGSGYEFWWQGADASSTLETVLSNSYLYYYSGSDLYDTLAGLNAGYVVVWGSMPLGEGSQHNFGNISISQHSGVLSPYMSMSSEAAVALYQDSADFSLENKIGPFEIFRLNNFTPSYVSILNGTGMANVTSLEPENIIIHLTNVSAGAHLLVRISYFTNWVVHSSQGRKLSIAPVNVTLPLDSADYMSVALPASGTYNVTLSYTQTSSDLVGNTISWATLIVLLLGIVLAEMKYDISKIIRFRNPWHFKRKSNSD